MKTEFGYTQLILKCSKISTERNSHCKHLRPKISHKDSCTSGTDGMQIMPEARLIRLNMVQRTQSQ